MDTGWIVGISGETFVMDGLFGTLIIYGIFALLIVMFFLLVNTKKYKAADKKAQENQKKLEEEIHTMETAYHQVQLDEKELQEKYEELKKSEEKSRKIAYTDYLTGLPNRTAFIEKLEHIILTLRKGENIGIMFLDLDNFKDINDTLGHSYGDELLIDVTDRLKQAIDENDFLGRIGGDEFAILSQNLEDISSYDEKIKKVQNVFSYPFVLAMKEFFVTISIGIGIAPKDGKSRQVIMKNVDAAMYKAKEFGKNTYYYFDESVNKKRMEMIELQSEIRHGIDHEEFVVHYQPQLDLTTNQIVGFEALVRWNHPTKGLLFPSEFLELSEETGLIVAIGKWVLTMACQQLRKLELDGYDQVTMAVNLCARQFKDENLFDMTMKIIEETGISPEHLRFEIKESIVLEDMVYAINLIEKMKIEGIQISLDNFGTGYSSVNYLKILQVNQIKIDKSYLVTLLDHENEQKMLTALIAFCQALELDIVVEGVEQEKQHAFLKTTGCNKVQGFLYSQPLIEEEMHQILQDRLDIHE